MTFLITWQCLDEARLIIFCNALVFSEAKGEDEINEAVCDVFDDTIGAAADAICDGALAQPELLDLCGLALEELAKWLCHKLLQWIEDQYQDILHLSDECICWRMGLCPQPRNEQCGESPLPPIEAPPPREDWGWPPEHVWL
jgi:hypothetical protein